MRLGSASHRGLGAGRRTLDIYFIDVEGGQSTLVVTPAGETLLIDTGFPSNGTFASIPGDPAKARDANRILAAARAAGVEPDRLFARHTLSRGSRRRRAGVVAADSDSDVRRPRGAGPQADQRVPGTAAAFDAYGPVRAKGKHLAPKPGDRIPLKGIETVVVSAAGATMKKPFDGAGVANPACGASAPAAQEPSENPRSTGVRLRYGRFTFLDVGDLTGAPLFALVWPANLIGPTDLYLVAHHGGPDAADPATFAAIAPRVAILNNGRAKGGIAGSAGRAAPRAWPRRCVAAAPVAAARAAILQRRSRREPRRVDGVLAEGEREAGWVVRGHERADRRDEALRCAIRCEPPDPTGGQVVHRAVRSNDDAADAGCGCPVEQRARRDQTAAPFREERPPVEDERQRAR